MISYCQDECDKNVETFLTSLSFRLTIIFMHLLYHYPFCPFSRIVRLALAIYGVDFRMVEERPWDRRTAFLKLNPAGDIPVLVDERTNLVIPGVAVIAEYLEELHADHGHSCLMPGDVAKRVEVRRLMGWFNEKFSDEVTRNLVMEKIHRRFMPKKMGGGSPDALAVRAGLVNIRVHIKYVGYLIRTRKWLAGDEISYADLAAAAHLSCVDYLDHVPWDEDGDARMWYARVKSQPMFRSLLADRVPGMPPSSSYANLDF